MRIQFSWKLTVVLIVILMVVGNLGSWQVRRYYEAQDTLKHYAVQHDELAPLTSLKIPDGEDRLKYLHHRRASFSGQFVPEEIQLLTARYKFQIPGYGVLIPMKVEDKKILVYIGWVPRDSMKDYLATLDPGQSVTVSGRLTAGDNTGHVSQPAGEHLGHTTWRETNLAALKERIPDLEGDVLLQAGEPATGKQIKIEDYPLGGYKGPWHVPPTRHVEYAIQWFGVGVAAIGVYIALTFRRRKREQPSDDEEPSTS
jgi:surfeit locus 1 family protein